jgi:hypothetical protein
MQSSLAVIAGPSAEKGSWARWYVAEADVGGGELVLSLEPWPIRFTCHDRSSAFLWADQNFRVVVPEVGPGAGQYKVNTRGYIYSIGRSDNPDEALHHFHWHPRDRRDPHAHVSSQAPEATTVEGIRGFHVPTGRVAFEAIARFLITDFQVKAVDEWEAILIENETLFARYRTWA